MKKSLLLITLILTVYLISFQKLSSNSGGISGFAGSPADNGQNCTACHSGTAQTASNVISTDIPATGYIPGEIYNISISVTHPTFNKFGFSFSAQNPGNGNQIGQFNLLNTTDTRINAQGKYVGHTSAGTQGSNNAKIWNFQWIAPNTPQGNVGFYGAFNLTNGNGNTSGDATQTQSIIIEPNPSVSLIDYKSTAFKFYPNPAAQGFINLEFPEGKGNIRLINLSGKILINENVEDGKLDLPVGLAKGFYLVEMSAGENVSTKKLLIK